MAGFAPNLQCSLPVSEATIHEKANARRLDQRLFGFLPNATASFFGSQWKTQSIYEALGFHEMTEVFPPILQAEGLHVAS